MSIKSKLEDIVKTENILKKVYNKAIDKPLRILNVGTLFLATFLGWQISKEYIDMINKSKEIIVKNQNSAIKQSSELVEKVLNIMRHPEEIITIDLRLKDLFAFMKEQGTDANIILSIPGKVPKELKITPEYVKYWTRDNPSHLLNLADLNRMIKWGKERIVINQQLENFISNKEYEILVKKISSEYKLTETIENIAKIFVKSDENSVESYTVLNRGSDEYCKFCHGYEGNKSLFLHTLKDIREDISKEIKPIIKDIKHRTSMMIGLLGLYGLLYGFMKTSTRKRYKSEEQYRQLLNLNTDAIYRLDNNGIITEIRPVIKNVLGYAPEALIGKNFSELMHKDDLEKFNRIHTKRTGTRSTERYECRFVRTREGMDAEIGWFSITAKGIYEKGYVGDGKPESRGEPKGKFIGSIGNIVDITKRKKAEEELKESEEKYRNLTETAVDAIITANPKGEIVSWNQGAKNIFGYSANETLNQPLTLIIPDRLKEKHKKAYKRVVSTGKSELGSKPIELYGLRKDGSEFPLEITFSPFKTSKDSFYTGIIRDITERRKIEEQLLKLSRAVEQSPVSVVITDKNGNIEYINPKFVQLTGYTLKEVIGQNPRVLKSGEQPKEYYKELWETICSGKEWQGEFHNKKKNGELYWESASISSIKDSNGEITHFVAIKEDITERKKIEKRLRLTQFSLDNASDAVFWINSDAKILYVNKTACERLGYSREETLTKNVYDFDLNFPKQAWPAHWKELEQKKSMNFESQNITKDGRIFPIEVTVNYLEFDGEKYSFAFTKDITEKKKMEKALIEKQRLSAIGEMASGIAHDFNNALTGVLGNAELALDTENLPQEVKDCLNVIKKSTMDIAVRVRQLQRFAGKSSMQKQHRSVNINLILEDVIQQSKPLWKDMMEKEGKNIAIKPEYGKVDNFLGDDGELRAVFYNIIKNSIEAMPNGGKIDIKTKISGESVYITIADTGTGMDEETKTRIFQPFYTTKGFEPGRGLGLSGVYSTLKEHHGEIYVKETSPGKGTTFEIKLPYVKEKISPLETEVKEYKGKANILWVDDESVIRNIAKKHIETLGHTGDVVESGKEALEMLRKNKYDLVITDIGMAGMSGWELSDIIKKEYKGKQKVAVVTGWGNEIDKEKRKKHGIGYILGKPMQIEQIRNLIGEVLQLKEK